MVINPTDLCNNNLFYKCGHNSGLKGSPDKNKTWAAFQGPNTINKKQKQQEQTHQIKHKAAYKGLGERQLFGKTLSKRRASERRASEGRASEAPKGKRASEGRASERASGREHEASERRARGERGGERGDARGERASEPASKGASARGRAASEGRARVSTQIKKTQKTQITKQIQRAHNKTNPKYKYIYTVSSLEKPSFFSGSFHEGFSYIGIPVCIGLPLYIYI